MFKLFLALCTSVTLFFSSTIPALGSFKQDTTAHTQARLDLFKSVSALTGAPWEFLAAINQFEDTINRSKEKAPFISIKIPPHIWAGPLNPIPHDINPLSISFFRGIGKDATGDKRADPKDATDILYSMALFLTQNGTHKHQIREQLWKYYQHSLSVDIITHVAEIFKKYQRIDLTNNVFPVPLHYEHSYQSTWGDPRGFGGRRIHEGTDIFARYGTPVLSTCYGYIELLGWNTLGGWRIGIRDTQSNYHYFAHLNHFKKGLKKGDIVKPGDVIGTVGSSGYGPPGTSGKFPPHLHFGLYTFNGKSLYSFDPYPHLKKWEKATRNKNKKQQKR